LKPAKSALATWMGVASIALLLFVSTAQTAHFCGPLSAEQSNTTELQAAPSATSSSGVCLTCLMAQSSVAAIVFLIFSPVECSRPFFVSLQLSPRSFLHSFRVSVRPPPVA
jgi:hypothetical protein